jgi:hypothetical protein
LIGVSAVRESTKSDDCALSVAASILVAVTTTVSAAVLSAAKAAPAAAHDISTIAPASALEYRMFIVISPQCPAQHSER